MCQLLSCLLRWAPFLIPFGSNLGSKRAPQKDSPFGHSFSRRELKEAGSKSGTCMLDIMLEFASPSIVRAPWSLHVITIQGRGVYPDQGSTESSTG